MNAGPKRLALFPLGKVVATPNALAHVSRAEILLALRRHQSADWGNLDSEDHAANNNALMEGGRILSAYHTRARRKFWIITEADRAVTTVLLPEDY